MYFLNIRYTRIILSVLPGMLGVYGHAQAVQNIVADSVYNRTLDSAIEWQRKADSLYHLSVEWRIRASKMADRTERGQLQNQIMILEDSLRAYRERADRLFAALYASRNPFFIPDTILHGIKVYRYNISEELFAGVDHPEKQSGTGAKKNKGNSAAGDSFGIHASSAYDAVHPFERDFDVPPGVFYRIQLAVYSREIPPDHFRGLYPITLEEIPEKAMTRYFVGKFNRLDSAKNALQRVRSAGFSDAFIIGYFNGVRGTLDKLQGLEKK